LLGILLDPARIGMGLSVTAAADHLPVSGPVEDNEPRRSCALINRRDPHNLTAFVYAHALHPHEFFRPKWLCVPSWHCELKWRAPPGLSTQRRRVRARRSVAWPRRAERCCVVQPVRPADNRNVPLEAIDDVSRLPVVAQLHP